ncbi:unnamed protein product [Acanthoscelides obtectus]|uniref:Uncharacterized protein n=1 Tax=Acanthoscelides obtectus TaxID=200917 RepID=A0A9P0JP52_ACAOB|nr:unnamed protein product [Acanthoscelides obtectus]CAK1673649.1 hypothetical protein AOBTE_LOCUS29405 [Acanthoscelides obtectus]
MLAGAALLISLLSTILCSVSVAAISSDDGSYELSNGNCTAPEPRDLVHMEHVQKVAIPFVTREERVTWYGDEKIYCVLVTSCNGETHSKVKLLRGGAGHTFVDLEVHSSRGYGFAYNVRIFGKE